MKRPNWLRRGGIAVLFSSIFVSVLTATLLSIITSVHSASALSLPSVELGLPLQNTPLAQVTNALNNVTSKLPVSVSVQNTPSRVDASVNTGIGGPTPLQADVNIPLPNVIPALTTITGPVLPAVSSTVAPIVNNVGNALPDMSPNRQSPQSPGVARTPQTRMQQRFPTTQPDPKSIPLTETATLDARRTTPLTGNTETSVVVAALGPLFTSTAQTLAKAPSDIHDLIAVISNRDLGSLPILISAATFFMMLVAITGIIYMTNRNKLSTFGNARLTQMAQLHDITQISVLIVVVVGAAIIAICLILAYFM